jgi:hypothetical protein
VGICPANLPNPARWSKDEAERQRKGFSMSNQFTLPDYSANLTTEDYNLLSHRAVSVIGADRILAMSKAQSRLLDHSLGRILRRRGSVDAVTEPELICAYEMIVEHVLPSFLEGVFSKASEQSA